MFEKEKKEKELRQQFPHSKSICNSITELIINWKDTKVNK